MAGNPTTARVSPSGAFGQTVFALTWRWSTDTDGPRPAASSRTKDMVSRLVKVVVQDGRACHLMVGDAAKIGSGWIDIKGPRSQVDKKPLQLR